jgi:hypothetical protein
VTRYSIQRAVYGPPLAAEHGADVVDGHRLDRLQRFARLEVQR